jgi:hypothetical protein
LTPPAGSQPLLRWTRGPMSVHCRPGTLAYRLQVKTRHGLCHHALPCVLQLWTSPPYQGELRCCHISCGSRPCLSINESSDAATCPLTLDLASLPSRAPALPDVLHLRTSPPYHKELLRCHVSYSSGPTSQSRRASALPRVPWLRIQPPHWEGFRHCHASHSSQWVTGVKREGSHRWLNEAFKARTFPRHTHVQCSSSQ